MTTYRTLLQDSFPDREGPGKHGATPFVRIRVALGIIRAMPQKRIAHNSIRPDTAGFRASGGVVQR